MKKFKYRNTRNGKVGFNTPEQAALFPHLELVADDAKPAIPEMFRPGFSTEKREADEPEEKESEVTKLVKTSKRKGGDK